MILIERPAMTGCRERPEARARRTLLHQPCVVPLHPAADLEKRGYGAYYHLLDHEEHAS